MKTVPCRAVEFAESIVHVDMDAFYVEVERRGNPSLRGKPVVVGGLGRRGVVASASYEARRFGVRSAMPMSRARRQCPNAVFLAPDHGRYRRVSEELFTVLRAFTPDIEQLSVDEAFLDIAGLRFHFPSPCAVGAAIRKRVREELDLPASVGVAATKFVAKVASAQAKPDGLLLVPAGEEEAFLHPLPIDRLWGVGEATRAALEELGAHTIGDLARIPARVVERRVGEALGRQLTRLSHAEDPRQVVAQRAARSVSVEETFAEDVKSPQAIHAQLRTLCDRLATRLRGGGHAGRTVSLKVRFADFDTVTRSITVTEPLAHGDELWEVTRRLLGRAGRRGRAVRLLGVAVSGLVSAGDPTQLTLEEPTGESIAVATEEVRARFGADAVVRGSDMERES